MLNRLKNAPYQLCDLLKKLVIIVIGSIIAAYEITLVYTNITIANLKRA